MKTFAFLGSSLSVTLLIISTSLCSAFEMEVAVKEIVAAPSWSRMNATRRAEDGPIMMATLQKYIKLEPENARKLVQQLADFSNKDQDARSNMDGKIYVFNRLYCNVPEKVDQNTWKFFGGWVGVPVKNGSVNAMHPLSLGKDGIIELTGSFRGYFGPRYQGLSEFDFLLNRFGRRVERKEHKDKEQ